MQGTVITTLHVMDGIAMVPDSKHISYGKYSMEILQFPDQAN